MALVIRDAWSGQPTHAIYVRHAHILKPLFHSDLKQALLHSTFRRVILRNKLGIKLDGRTFSSLIRELDPRFTGYVKYDSFARHLQKDYKLAKALELRFVSAEQAGKPTFKNEMRTWRKKGTVRRETVVSNNNPSSLGVGVTQRRLRRELVRQMSAQVRREEEEFRMMSKQEKRDYRARQRGEPIKKKREMLRHEKTEIFGAGILMILPTTTRLPPTEAKDAWSNPKTKLTLRGRFD